MAEEKLLKPDLERVAIFGGNSRIGLPVAKQLLEARPEINVRLIVRSERHRAAIESELPQAEITIADYYDLASLEAATDGCDGVFVLTPNRLDEERAMSNLVFALRRNHGQVKHIVRLLGDPPGMSMDKVPDTLRNAPGGTAIQHLVAKEILAKSRLPITYVNVAAYFMQNYSGPLFALGIRKHRVLISPRNRRMAYIDADDIGRCVSALLLSNDHRHIGMTYHLDNGIDVLRFDEVAALMSEVWDEPIGYDGSDESFLRMKFMNDMNTPLDFELDKEDYWISYSQFEQDNQHAWRKTDIVEYLTGTPAKPLRTWLEENRDAVLHSTAVPRKF